MKTQKLRKCGFSLRPNIPFGIDWHIWANGHPVCEECSTRWLDGVRKPAPTVRGLAE